MGPNLTAANLNFLRKTFTAGRKTAELYVDLRKAIEQGKLAWGTKLPSTRDLAQALNMARATVNVVYERLIADGLLETSSGSGTFVRFQLPVPAKSKPQSTHAPLSNFAKSLNQHVHPAVKSSGKYHLNLFCPDVSNFPLAAWKTCLRAALRQVDFLQGPRQDSPLGLLLLRKTLAHHLNQSRGLRLKPENLLISSGSANGIYILFRLLLEPGSKLLMEEPCYYRARQLAISLGAKLIPAPVTEQGIQLKEQKAEVAFLTPACHYPSGITTSLEARLELLRWAEQQQAFLIEDDFDVDFRRSGLSSESLLSLDKDQRVCYLGSFSTTLSPHVRLGYVILPDSLVEPATKLKLLLEAGTAALLEQAAVALFIRWGHYQKHLKKMRRVYAEKHQAFEELVLNRAPTELSWCRADSGLSRFAYWQSSEKSLKSFTNFCSSKGLSWEDASRNFIAKPKASIHWGYSHLELKEMKAIGRIVSSWKGAKSE